MNLLTITGVGVCPTCNVYGALRTGGLCAHCQIIQITMSDSKKTVDQHTPGPWKAVLNTSLSAEQKKQYKDGQWIIITDHSHGHCIASVVTGIAASPEQVKANAELIAQCPGMMQQILKYKELAEQTARMRKLQKEYFKFKDSQVLRECKNVEFRVDRLLEEVRNG